VKMAWYMSSLVLSYLFSLTVEMIWYFLNQLRRIYRDNSDYRRCGHLITKKLDYTDSGHSDPFKQPLVLK
jgi:hypothetical protein